MSAPVILLVEDDVPLRQSLAQWLSLNEFTIVQTEGGREALKALNARHIDAIISDVRMKGMSGLELLPIVRKTWPEMPVIMLSGHGDVPMAVAAMQGGALTFLTKPYIPEQLVSTLRIAVESSRLRRRVADLEHDADAATRLERQLLGMDQSTQKLRATVGRIANYPVDVLIRGETGTGKEVVARLLHDCSRRSEAPYVAINCAALPADIIESELFGHETGAFTGAAGARIGKFEFANGGTIFLDEVESMPLAAQAKLLRVLQERKVTRLGSNRETPLDIRIVSATKESLAELSARGLFREDLYYRLMGAEITIAPVRERGHDAVLLFMHFSRAMSQRLEREFVPLTTEETAWVLAYGWPGNVRQLKLLAERHALDIEWCPSASATAVGADMQAPLAERVDQFELGIIQQALDLSGGKTATAAGLLGIPVRTLNEKLQRLAARANG